MSDRGSYTQYLDEFSTFKSELSQLGTDLDMDDLNDLSASNVLCEEDFLAYTVPSRKITIPEASNDEDYLSDSFDEQHEAKESSDDEELVILKEGWLKKQNTGGFLKSWKKRWCVVYTNGLFRYYDKPGLNPKHRKGKGDVIFEDLKVTGQDRHTFWVGTNKRLWRFAAKHCLDAAKWLNAFTYRQLQVREQQELQRESRQLPEPWPKHENTIREPCLLSTLPKPRISKMQEDASELTDTSSEQIDASEKPQPPLSPPSQPPCGEKKEPSAICAPKEHRLLARI